MSIHPQFIEHDGKKQFAILPYDEFLAMQQALEDAEDLGLLREAVAEAESTGDNGMPFEEFVSELKE